MVFLSVCLVGWSGFICFNFLLCLFVLVFAYSTCWCFSLVMFCFCIFQQKLSFTNSGFVVKAPPPQLSTHRLSLTHPHSEGRATKKQAMWKWYVVYSYLCSPPQRQPMTSAWAPHHHRPDVSAHLALTLGVSNIQLQEMDKNGKHSQLQQAITLTWGQQREGGMAREQPSSTKDI